MNNSAIENEIAVFRAVGSGRMSVSQRDGCHTFRVTGRKNSITISDDEATELARAILGEVTDDD